MTAVLGGTNVVCSESELTLFESPPGMTCGEYAGSWLADKSVGYLSNANSTGTCGYCQYSYGDDVSLHTGLKLENMKLDANLIVVSVWNWP